MKNYIYLSQRKVDELYEQIPKNILEKIATELHIDLKVMGVGIEAVLKPNQPEPTRYSKLRLVAEYLEKHGDVGWIDAPKTYFKGTLPMRFGVFPSVYAPKLIYFGGSTKQTIFGMAGSPKHMAGYEGVSSIGDLPVSAMPFPFLEEVLESKDFSSSEPLVPGTDADVQSIEYMTTILAGPVQSLEFLAKTYLHLPRKTQNSEEEFILFGSPIYVAFM